MIDLTTYDDGDLDALRRDVLTEQERREQVANAPSQITALAKEAAKSGVSPETIRSAVEDGLTPEQQSAPEEA